MKRARGARLVSIVLQMQDDFEGDRAVRAGYSGLNSDQRMCETENAMGTRFENKLVVVAGGTGGLGRAVSLAFLAESARVAVTYRAEAEWAALKSAAGAN